MVDSHPVIFDNQHMATEPAHKRLTYEDYVKIPDDGKKYEIIDGRLILKDSASADHQGVGLGFLLAFGNYFRSTQRGRVIYDLDTTPAKFQVLRPDILVFRKERMRVITKKRALELPDIVIEILSSNYRYDLGRKRHLYAEYGAKEYWVAYQAIQRVDVYKLAELGKFASPVLYESGDTLTTDLFPDFALPILTLYEELAFPEPGLDFDY